MNTRLLVNDVHGGIEWFSYECLKRITRDHPEHTFYFLFDRAVNKKYIFSDNIIPLIVKPATIHPLLWYYWFEKRIPRILKKINPDIFLSPEGMIPLKTNIPCITVIHDINFYHRKNDLPRLKSLYYRKYFEKYARKAIRLVTVSEYSKQDMVDSWGIDPGKIDVVYNGAAEEFRAVSTEKESVPFFNDKGKQYFLFVGNLSPRKNIPGLIRAYDTYRKVQKGEASLIIAGEKLFLNGEVDRIYKRSEYRSEIHFVGKKSREELAELYSGANALVYIPWFEGFGIPIVEAMKCGSPVIASDTTSMPEIAGDAAILINPSDINKVAKEMRNLERDTKLRETLITKGFKNADRFSWDKTASLLWQSVERSIKD